jgi:hypothetical protein
MSVLEELGFHDDKLHCRRCDGISFDTKQAGSQLLFCPGLLPTGPPAATGPPMPRPSWPSRLARRERCVDMAENANECS